MSKQFFLIGAALGWGAQKLETELGPCALQSFGLAEHLQARGLNIQWYTTVRPSKTAEHVGLLAFAKRTPLILETQQMLAAETAKVVAKGHFPIVLGGDHSIAVGTWSGVVASLEAEQNFGLIWFDAHMDAHTPQTTPSQAIHGMPLAALLGYGMPEMVQMLSNETKLNPSHVVLIGIRSYEPEEEKLLEDLGVRIYKIDEVNARGLEVVCQEALSIVKQARYFGISIDVDGFDPLVAPGTGSLEPNGLDGPPFLDAFKKLVQHPQCRALEIAEFNPMLDREHITATLIENIILNCQD